MAQLLRSIGSGDLPLWATGQRVAAVDREYELPFSDTEYEQRKATVRKAMLELELDALVVFRPSSVEYLTAYHTVAEPIPLPAILLPDELSLLALAFEAPGAVAKSRVDEILYYTRADDGWAVLAKHLAGKVRAGARVGVEMDAVWVPPRVVDELRNQNLKVVHAPLVENARLILSPAEIGYMREAGKITAAGIEAAVTASQASHITDAELAAAIRSALTEHANSLAGLDVIVAQGSAGGIPHSTWRGSPIDRSKPVVLEFAGAYHRYCTPVMRTLAFADLTGDAATLDQLASHCHQLVKENLRAGRRCADIAAEISRELRSLPEWVVFHFVYGYPVGIAHPPTWMDGAFFYLSEQNHGIVRPGMVFHCPASFRSFGESGVCYSQTFLVTADGVEALSPGEAAVTYIE